MDRACSVLPSGSQSTAYLKLNKYVNQYKAFYIKLEVVYRS